MNKAVQRYLDAASGLGNLTTAKAEQVVKQMVNAGEAAGDQAQDLVKELLERQQRNREAVSALVKAETTRAVRAMGLATGTEVERLQKQVADLKRELSRVERERTDAGSGASTRAATTSTKKASRKSTKKSTKKATKKASKKASKKATERSDS